jgi:AcrR family transcriptional regulator
VPRAKQRTAELRDRVLAVALSTLAGDGVAGLTARRVAAQASTSVPAVYELFGDKAGLVREVYFEGFRRLRARLAALPPTDEPLADLIAMGQAFRAFARANPVLTEVMFARPFADFDPGPEELAATGGTREHIVALVRRAVDARLIGGDPVDVAHILLALAQGLAAQENAGWLGSSTTSADRRWTLAFAATLAGLGSALPRAGLARDGDGKRF